jgi:hypothetical protein
VWIGTGDVVLISLRIYDGDDSDDGDSREIFKAMVDAKKGDILATYDPEIYGKLKKVDGINTRLFDGMESINAGSKRAGAAGRFDDDGIDFDHGDDDELGEESSVDSDGEKKRGKTWKRPAAAAADDDDDDVNIDAI